MSGTCSQFGPDKDNYVMIRCKEDRKLKSPEFNWSSPLQMTQYSRDTHPQWYKMTRHMCSSDLNVQGLPLLPAQPWSKRNKWKKKQPAGTYSCLQRCHEDVTVCAKILHRDSYDCQHKCPPICQAVLRNLVEKRSTPEPH